MEQELHTICSLSSPHTFENEWIQIRNLIFTKYAFFLEMGGKFSQVDTNQTDLQRFIDKLFVGTEAGACTIAMCLLLAIQSENVSLTGTIQHLRQIRQLFSFAIPAQLLFVSKQAVIISEYIVKEATHSGHASSIINVLIHAAKLLSRDVYLTPIHCHVLQSCLSSRQFRVADKFLKSFKNLVVDPDVCYITTADCLAYYYYGALCFIAIESYDLALSLLNQAILIPSNSISSIIIISIKKAYLLSLLYMGEKYTIPKTTAGAIQRFCQEDLQLYETISTLFLNSDQTGLLTCINEIGNKKKLLENNDWGLVNLLFIAMTKETIKTQSDTYMNIPISTLTEMIKTKSVSDTEKVLLSHDNFNCRIDKQTQIVYFEDEKAEESGSELKDLTTLLQEELSSTSIASAQMRDMFSTLYTSKVFVKNIKQSPT